VKKGQVVPVYAMNSHSMSRITAPLFLKLHTQCRWMVTFTLSQLYPRKEPQHLSNRRLHGLRAHLCVLEKRKITCTYFLILTKCVLWASLRL